MTTRGAELTLGEARSQAERLASGQRFGEARQVLVGGLVHTYSLEEEYRPAVHLLANILTQLGDARGAVTCYWYANVSEPAKKIWSHLPPQDRARTLVASAGPLMHSDPRSRDLLIQAAAEFESAAMVAHAAVQRERAGDFPTARGLWSRLCQRIGTSDLSDTYAGALARFNLARTSLKVGDEPAAREAVFAAVHLLEEAADRYESVGQRERAFDCYHVLVAIGREFRTLEHVLEGYVNLIRILKEDQLRQHAMQSYDEAIRYGQEHGELSASAGLAREMAVYAQKQGRMAEANFAMLTQARLWREVARQSLDRKAPPEIAENALLASVLSFAELNQFQSVGEIYAELAQLPLEEARCKHYTRAANRYVGARDERTEAVAPDALRRDMSVPDVWHVDLLEWEQRGFRGGCVL